MRTSQNQDPNSSNNSIYISPVPKMDKLLCILQESRLVCSLLLVLQELHSDIIHSVIHRIYSQKIWRGIKFGSLVVYLCNHHIKIRHYFILVYNIHIAIPYQTANLNLPILRLRDSIRCAIYK